MKYAKIYLRGYGMHKHVGANKRRKHGEKRRAAGKVLGRMAGRFLSAGKIAAIALLV